MLLRNMPWYFIPRVLKLANTKTHVWNGYDWDSETVNMLARHIALKRWNATEIRWYRNVVSRGSRMCKAWLFCRFLLWCCELRLTMYWESLPGKNMWVAESVLYLVNFIYGCWRMLSNSLNEFCFSSLLNDVRLEGSEVTCCVIGCSIL